MTDDFSNRLRLQLVEAAEREERRGVVARRMAGARHAVPRLSAAQLAAALVVVVILALAAYEVTTLRPEPTAPLQPKIVVRLAPAASLGELTYGFGSAWVDDTARGQLLRIDPRSRRVTARIDVRGSAAIGAGAGSLWVVESTGGGFDLAGPLLRIDPRTNRVTARVPLRTPAGAPFRAWRVEAAHDVVWIIGARGALRVDSHATRVTKAIRVDSSYELLGAATVGDDLWMLVASGRLLRFDAHTGERKSILRAPLDGDLVAVGNVLLVRSRSEVARVDPDTGRVLWRTALQSEREALAAIAHDLLWLPTIGDRLVAIDPLTGRIVSTTRIGEFGAIGIDAVGSDVWVSTAGGRVVAVRP